MLFKNKGFVHLRACSHYSLGDGAMQPKDIVKAAYKMKMPAISICDKGNLFGSLEFSQAALDNGIQPIISSDLEIVEEGAFSHRIPLYVKNETGYKNLLNIVSNGFLDPSSSQKTPSTSIKRIAERSEGLIALQGSIQSSVGMLLIAGKKDEAKQYLIDYQSIFKDSLYIELSRHNNKDEISIEESLVNLAFDLNIPLVATNHAYFLTPEMREAHEIFLSISDGKFIHDETRRRFNENYRLKTPEEMLSLFSDIPEAIDNTMFVASRCSYTAPSRPPNLPKFPTENGIDERTEFERQAREGLEMRLNKFVLTPEMTQDEAENKRKLYSERLEFELQVINRMNYAGYFLIVSDFIKWSKANNIPVGPGRGSGAGSLVAWSLQITDLDPIHYNLLFERFLNPDRVSMPDFDIDFCQDRRGEVIEYVRDKYGNDRVAQIITFGKLQARAVLRDVGRVLQMPYSQVDRICKLVPVNPANPVDLKKALEIEPLLNKAAAEEEIVAKMIDIALKLEGLNRHSSTHAAGIVIADKPLIEAVPVFRDPRSDMPVIQYTMKYAEEAGLVKFDFLGLKTLTVISRAVQMIAKSGINLDMSHIDEKDKRTYEMLGKGDAIGVFQLESSGMRDTLRKMKPDSIEDIIALISLYRPGPMDNIPVYIARKHGLDKPEYPHPSLEEILQETFGVIIYQEQVMQIAQKLAGYTLAEADLLRRAMGKKIKAEMEAQRNIFAEKAVTNGVNKNKAAEIFDLIAKFASYGFNKSHAAAYAVISYQTAFLKANFPAEFYAANMSYEINDTDKLSMFRNDAKKSGIQIIPPDINSSDAEFSVQENEGKKKSIMYALGAIRNVGESAMAKVVEERERNGSFKDIFDFAKRVHPSVMNKRQLEFLIKSGALDSLHPNRKELFESIDMLVSYNNFHNEDKDDQQASLFGEIASFEAPKPNLKKVQEWSLPERMKGEFEAIGFYLSAHPIESYLEILKNHGICWSDRFSTQLDVSAYKPVTVAGVVIDKKFKVSQKGRFGFIELSDHRGTFEVAIFDEILLDNSRSIIEAGALLIIQAEAKMEDAAEESNAKIIAKKISPIENILKDKKAIFSFRISNESELERLHQLLSNTPKGNMTVKIDVKAEENSLVKIKLPNLYAINPAEFADFVGV